MENLNITDLNEIYMSEDTAPAALTEEAPTSVKPEAAAQEGEEILAKWTQSKQYHWLQSGETVSDKAKHSYTEGEGRDNICTVCGYNREMPFADSLGVIAKGMGGIFIVTLAMILCISLLNKLTSKKKSEEN